MREILFRGKPKNEAEYKALRELCEDDCKNGFVYGSLVVSHGKYYICGVTTIQVRSGIDDYITTMIEVFPETVGEYTCLKDKNGKKVFEGDILKAEIWWEQGGCYPHTETCFIEATFPNMYKNHFEKFEVVGNIYDNPELLRSEE